MGAESEGNVKYFFGVDLLWSIWERYVIIFSCEVILTDKVIRRLTFIVIAFMLFFGFVMIFDYDHIMSEEKSGCVKCEIISTLLENLLKLSKFFVYIFVIVYVMTIAIKWIRKRVRLCTPLVLKVQFNE